MGIMNNENGNNSDMTNAEIARIQSESQLNPTEMQAALLDACAVKPAEISARLGLGEQYVYQKRWNNPEYKRVVMEFRQLISRRIVDEVSDIDDLFNRQIGPSAATLIEVRDNTWAKDGDRLKAALAILDRAPKAPKATQQTISAGMTVQIPISAMREMVGVLGETGSAADVELAKLIEQREQPPEVIEVAGEAEEKIEVRRL